MSDKEIGKLKNKIIIQLPLIILGVMLIVIVMIMLLEILEIL